MYKKEFNTLICLIVNFYSINVWKKCMSFSSSPLIQATQLWFAEIMIFLLLFLFSLSFFFNNMTEQFGGK